MNIVIYVPAGVHSLEVSGPEDVFAEANLQSDGAARYKIRVVSERNEPILCNSGLRIMPDMTIHDPDTEIDTLLVTGRRTNPAMPPEPELLAWLRRRVPAARRYGSICTGTFILGAAGLLDGKRVTTHWACAEELAAMYPRARIEPEHIFIRDGNLVTSGGLTAGIDHALALVEEDHGKALAFAVARRLVMFLKRPGGQSQFSMQIETQIAAATPIQRCQAWVRDNLQSDLSVAKLAGRAGMSARNFARAFRQETGMTPARFVENTRLTAAQHMLADSNLSIQKIAILSGHYSSDRLRRVFLRRLGVTPANYRARFQTTASAEKASMVRV